MSPRGSETARAKPRAVELIDVTDGETVMAEVPVEAPGPNEDLVVEATKPRKMKMSARSRSDFVRENARIIASLALHVAVLTRIA